jgi:cytochrome c
MPQDRPGSLTNDEVYAVTAYLLARNQVVAESAVLDATSLPTVKMPSRDRFVRDDRESSTRVR